MWVCFFFLSEFDSRLGTCALTSRDFTAAQMEDVAEFLHRGIKVFSFKKQGFFCNGVCERLEPMLSQRLERI